MGTTETKFLEGMVNLPYRWALGPVFTRFFDEFQQQKIMGTRCPACKRVLVPARRFCPRCFDECTEWVQVSDKGTVRAWTLITFTYMGQPKPPPYIQGLIDLEGANTAFAHFIGGIDLSDLDKARDHVEIGMKVEAKWKAERQGNIFDIDHFAPII